MKNLLDFFRSKTLTEVGEVVDNLSTSDDEKLKAKNDLSTIVLSSLSNVIDAQREALVTEIKGNWLQRSWRPLLMLAFGFIVVYEYFIAPVFSLHSAGLPERFFDLLEIGIGGYVIGRTIEKTTATLTKNTDISFLRKKDRKKDQ